MRPLERPLGKKIKPKLLDLQGNLGHLYGAGDVLLQRVPHGSIGIHKIKVYKAESTVSVSIGVHRLTQKETLGETLGDAGHKKRGRQLSLPFFVVRL